VTYRRVLAATDYSAQSLAAAKLARAIAAPGARMRVAHVTPLAEMPPRIDLRADVQRSQLAEWCGKADLPTEEAVVLFGSAAKEIAKEAAGMEADLVALGHTGLGRVAQLLLGSVARSVVRLAPCDALVARGSPPPSAGPALRHVMVATDLYAPSARAAERALEIATAHAAELSLVHAVDPDVWQMALRTPRSEFPEAPDWVEHTYGGMVHDFNVKHLGGKGKEVVVHGSPARVVAEEATRRKADLLVVGTHGAHGLERLLLGTHAEAIVERAPCSVLVVR
jgi:nucleotide-binding universal stress UspA family protein